MLWHKSWMELRYRFALSVLLAIYAVYLILVVAPPQVQAKFPMAAPPELVPKIWKIFLFAFGGAILPITAKILAGAGINAQTSMGMSRGFHGSMGFLLSMPVSRTQLLATRASFGAALMLLLAIATFASIQMLGSYCNFDFSSVGIWQSFPNTFLVSGFFYCLAVWLSSFLDEFWAGTVGLLVLGAFGGMSMSASGTILDLVSYLFSPEPLTPVSQTFALLAASAVLLLAARWVVDRKEY